MLAYTAGDSLQAITRNYGFGSCPTLIERMDRAARGDLIGRAVARLGRWLCGG